MIPSMHSLKSPLRAISLYIFDEILVDRDRAVKKIIAGALYDIRSMLLWAEMTAHQSPAPFLVNLVLCRKATTPTPAFFTGRFRDELT